ncbi:MAG: aminotransferase class I/II-fold pyridoxal phosphate-dependent enzyme [Gammaproteobacteria bacterium]
MITSKSRRGTHSKKWDKYSNQDILPLWIADMDFQSPEFLQKAFLKRIEHNTYGYTKVPKVLNEALIEYYEKKQQWVIDDQWIVWVPNLVTAIYAVNQMAAHAKQELIIPEPIYPPFREAAKHLQIPHSILKIDEINGRFSYDFNRLEKLLHKDSWLMLANPCNPGGSVLNPEESEKIISLINKKNSFLLADEIHSDLILDPKIKFLSLGKDKRILNKTITLHSSAKTFNIPGLSCGFAIIPSIELRKKFQNIIHGIVPDPSLFGIIGTLECFKKGEPWRRSLIKKLQENRDICIKHLSQIANLKFIVPEATFLIWIKILHKVPKSGWGKYFENFGIGISDGKDFGAPQCIRLNFGTSTKNLKEALKRIALAMDALNG